MGLLSNPSLSQRNKLGRNLAKYMRPICFLFYFAGIVWFLLLANPDFNHSTYLSENALSPGLVYPEVKSDSNRLAHSLLEELKRERETHKSTTPHSWILAKMQQIGLETHVHNFTLNYPYGGGKVYHGKNIYGILRASRIGSTEGIVFSAPYRPPSSVHTEITASVPLLLTFADFVRTKNYWAKDLVFLVTEQEQLGMHAWLEAYHNGGLNSDASILDSGFLEARAGALQAAVNLELQDLDVDFIDVKLEGLNGQLPNLDMFNLVQRITAREGILSGYKQKPRRKRRSMHDTLKENLANMIEMIISQATGVPNGNHGLFHRYRIESLTLEGYKRPNSNHNNNRLAMLKTLEGISRSLNNLLERFHQSYFFYILVQDDRFISIGDFIPCIILMASAMFIKAFLLWLTIDNFDDFGNEINITTDAQEIIQIDKPYRRTLVYIGIAVLMGVLCYALPMSSHVNAIMAANGWTIVASLTTMLVVFVFIGSILPLAYALPEGGLELLHIGTLICLGVTFTVLGLLNFSLGMFVALFCAPLAILVDITSVKKWARLFMCIYAVLLNPLVVIYAVVWVLTLFQFPELTLGAVSIRALTATMDAFTFGLMDSLIYGSWLFTFITTLFLPLWILLWTLCLSLRQKKEQLKEKLN